MNLRVAGPWMRNPGCRTSITNCLVRGYALDLSTRRDVTEERAVWMERHKRWIFS